MREAWREGAIGFGDRDCTHERDCDIAFFYWKCYPEGAVAERYPLAFCPFCGVAIEIEHVGGVPITKPLAP